MCGIAAIIAPQERTAIENMVSAMRHRGPDDKGIWTKDSVQLGMSRLAILDLSPAGHQPMVSEDGRYVLIFNGEIYNFKELREQFLGNVRLRSGGDTIVLLHLFQQMGIACVQHLRGMFAFVVYDTETEVLWGARDRLGIKPLLYYQQGQHLVISSELKSMLASGSIPFELNDEAVRQYFMYGSAQLPNTFVKDVYMMAPGTWFSYCKGRLTIRHYWGLPNEINVHIKESEAIEEFKAIYNEAMQLRMISDRTVGLFFSSGLESASMLASQVGHPRDLRTFTIGFKTRHDKYYSEISAARKLSEHFGYRHDGIEISAFDATKDIDAFVYGLDQPSIDGLNTYLVSKYSREHLTVALSGLGGDELLLGYPRNINLFNLISRKLHMPRGISERYLLANTNDSKAKSYLMDLLMTRAGGLVDLKLLYWSKRVLNKSWEVNEILEQRQSAIEDISNFYVFDEDVQYYGNDFNRISYYELRSYMLSQLLRDMDAVSMSQSIEVRFPFTDHKLVEFLFTLPWQYKYQPQRLSINNRSGVTTYASSGIKAIMQNAYRAVLPPGYFDTPKQGFQLPVQQWMQEFLGTDIEDTYQYLLNEADTPISRKFIHKCLLNIRGGIFGKNEHLVYVFGKWHVMIKKVMEEHSVPELAKL